MRFVFTPPADHAAGLLTLPWAEPLADWHDDRLLEIRQRGISRPLDDAPTGPLPVASGPPDEILEPPGEADREPAAADREPG